MKKQSKVLSSKYAIGQLVWVYENGKMVQKEVLGLRIDRVANEPDKEYYILSAPEKRSFRLADWVLDKWAHSYPVNEVFDDPKKVLGK